MSTKMSFGLLSFLLLAIMANGQSNVKERDAQHTAENHPVRELYLSSIEAFNAGNLELFLANFASEIKMYGTDGIYVGQNALRERFQDVFQQFPNKKMEIPELTLDILSEEIVLVNFKWRLYPMGQGPAYCGVGSGLYTFRAGKWVEILEVETVTHVDEALRP